MWGHVQPGSKRRLSVWKAYFRNMVLLKYVACHHDAILFLLLLPPVLSVPYYDLGDQYGGEWRCIITEISFVHMEWLMKSMKSI